MTEEENQNIAPIKDGELLHIANNILSMLESSNQLDDENLVDYMKEELKTHQKMEEELMNLLEDVKNE